MVMQSTPMQSNKAIVGVGGANEPFLICGWSRWWFFITVGGLLVVELVIHQIIGGGWCLLKVLVMLIVVDFEVKVDLSGT